MWTAKRVVSELCSDGMREELFSCLWTSPTKTDIGKTVEKALASALHFRPATVHGAAVAKKVAWFRAYYMHPLVQRSLQDVLRHYFLTRQEAMIDAFLTACDLPHEGASIGDEKVELPDDVRLRDIALQIGQQYGTEAVLSYLVTAGLVMGEEWVDKGWPVVDGIVRQNANDAAIIAPPRNDERIEADSSSDSAQAEVEVFTTLDQLMIKSIIRSVSETEGALDHDQIGDVVEELIHLNTDRQPSYFHRGFLSALLSVPKEASSLELNDGRRAWTLAGELTAHARRRDWKTIVSVCSSRPADVNVLLQQLHGAAIPAARHVFEAYCQEEMWSDAVRNMSPRLAARLGHSFIEDVLVRASTLLLGKQVEFARPLLDLLLQTLLHTPADMTHRRRILFETQRRHAQCLRAEGKFDRSIEAFEQILANDGEVRAAEIRSDIALARAEFRWLSEICVPTNESDAKTMSDRIRNVAGALNEALKFSGNKSNAHYALGVLALLENENAKARVHFLNAYEGATADRRLLSRYQDGGLYGRLLLNYSLSIFLEYRDANFTFAIGLMRDADRHHPRSEWPEWLLRKALEIAVQFSGRDGHELLEFVAGQFPGILEDFTRNIDLLHKSKRLLDLLRSNAVNAHRPRSRRFDDNAALARYCIDVGEIEEAETALDNLETLAFADSSLRPAFINFVSVPGHYDPAWEEEDVIESMANIFELDGQPARAGERLLFLGHRYLQQQRWDEAMLLLERMRGLGVDETSWTSLSGRLGILKPQVDDAPEAIRDLLTAGAPIRVLFIGGGEMQGRYEAPIREALARELGDVVQVAFYCDAWAKGWGTTFDELKHLMPKFDTFVLSSRMRTQLGRRLRQYIGTMNKGWGACTAVGVGTALRAIEAVARRTAQQRATAPDA